jgi:pimeloyl-ACP methyl ester carboxylesterase
MFAPLIERLPSHYCGIAIDLRGHGDSAPPPGLDFDWQGFATDLLTVTDGLAIDRPFVVGHSCGATAAFLAEQRRPGTFRRMYCYEPAIAFRDNDRLPGPNPLSASARRRRATFASPDELFGYLRSKPLFERFDPAVLDAYADHGFARDDDGSLRLKCLPEYEARTFEHGASHNGVGRLGEITCPVGLVYGDAADPFPAEMAQLVHAGLRNATLHTAQGLGHLGPFENPAQIASDIAQQFDGAESA